MSQKKMTNAARKKMRKSALISGTDPHGNPLHYSCVCGKVNGLHCKKCPVCGTKRRFDAYEHALKRLEDSRREELTPPVREPVPQDVFVQGKFVALPSERFLRMNYSHEQPEGIPTYYSSDEYGRVFKVNVTYGNLPFAGPVPVPAPSPMVQQPTILWPFGQQKP